MNNDQNKSIIYYLIKEKSFSVILFFLLLTIFGIISIFKIKIEIMPSEATPSYLYFTADSAVSNQTIKTENVLGLNLEKIFRSLPKLKNFDGTILNSSASYILTYAPKTNMDEAYLYLQEATQNLVSEKKG